MQSRGRMYRAHWKTKNRKCEQEESKVIMKIKLDPGAYMPERAHAEDAGLDLRAMEDQVIYPAPRNHRQTIGFFAGPDEGFAVFDTGVHAELPRGYYGKVESKSGLNVKHSIVSCGGVIDAGYTGSIRVKLYNLGSEPYRVSKGDKIAQLIIQPYISPELELVDELAQTERGDNGFGSTGR